VLNQTSKSTARAPAAAPHILIVEDDSDLTLLLSYNLEAEGYVVESVTRGDEVDLRLTESVPDLVILDWMLPGLSGVEICQRLRTRGQTRELPVIMVTGRSGEAERVRGLSVGADDYVIKPFSMPELLARIRGLLRRSRPERIAEGLRAGELDLDRNTRRVRRGLRVTPSDAMTRMAALREQPSRACAGPMTLGNRQQTEEGHAGAGTRR
jgi:two-component system, OmpR family, phosphate regulon response regulator PhoB